MAFVRFGIWAAVLAAIAGLGACSSSNASESCNPIPCPAPGFDPNTCACATRLGSGMNGGAGGGSGASGGAGATASNGSGAGGAAHGSASGASGVSGTGSAGSGDFDPFNGDASVSVVSMIYELGLPPLLILPNFPIASGSTTPTCTAVRYGACIVDNCSGVDPNATRLSAGTITVDSPAASVHVAATVNGQDYTMTSGDKPFSGGEALTVSGVGADIPAFSVGMQVPLMLLVDQPTMPALDPTTVAVAAPHATPLTLTWERGAPGVYLVVQSLDIQGFGRLGAVNARCFFDSQAGTGTVPAAVLSDVEVGQQFVLLTANATVTQAGTQPITVWVVSEALTPDKKSNVVLQVQ